MNELREFIKINELFIKNERNYAKMSELKG